MKLYKLLGTLAVLLMIVMAAAPAGADSAKPSLAVSAVTISPTALMPGDKGTITVTISNPTANLAGDTTSDSNTYNYGTGTSGMTSITHSQTTTTSSSNTPDGAVILKEVSLLGDAPLHVTSKSFNDYGRLGMGSSTQFQFTIAVDANAADGNYPMTLKVRTDDSAVYLNFPITVVVSSAAPKIVINDAPKAFSTTKKTVVLDIVNLRPNGITDVSVVPAGTDFTFKPQQEYVVGSIGTGELYTVQFDVTANNVSFNGNPSFKVVYKNGDNWHETAAVTTYSDHTAAVAASSAATDDNSLLYLIGIIVLAAIVLGGVFLYMRSKRTK